MTDNSSQPRNETPTSPSVNGEADDMLLYVALSFADHPRPRPTLQAPADTMDELREALRVLAKAYRAAISRSEAPVACCKGIAPSWDCRCEQERLAQGHPPYQRAPSPDTRVREALDELQSAESTYRMCHDIDGDGHINTGRAWVKLRQAGARARSALATLPRPGAVEPQTTVDELLGQIASSDRAEAVARVRAKSPALDPATVEEALRPFAALADMAHVDHRDSRPFIFAFDTAVAQRLTIGDLRRAKLALAGKDGA